jgi:hypothetical protein
VILSRCLRKWLLDLGSQFQPVSGYPRVWSAEIDGGCRREGRGRWARGWLCWRQGDDRK